MSACCSHCNSLLMSCWVTLMCFWKSLFRWISTSVLVYHMISLFWGRKKKKRKKSQHWLLPFTEKKQLKPRASMFLLFLLLLLWRMIQCVCGCQVSEVIFHTFLCSIFYLHWLMAPALHVCNKCYSVLFFLCSCVVFLSTDTAARVTQSLFHGTFLCVQWQLLFHMMRLCFEY